MVLELSVALWDPRDRNHPLAKQGFYRRPAIETNTYFRLWIQEYVFTTMGMHALPDLVEYCIDSIDV